MPPSAHPYMASSAPALKQELLEATGASSVEELFEQIPESHRLRGELNLPPALRLGGRAAPAPARLPAQERHLRGDAQLPRRRLLAAPRARDLRRAGRAHRVRHLDLGHSVVRSRAQPDLVRVREPARRADRHGLRRHAGLQLRLRGRTRDPHGVAHHRPSRGARARVRWIPSASPSSAPTASRARWPATSTSSSSITTPRRACSTMPTSSASSRPRPPRCTSRTPRTSE